MFSMQISIFAGRRYVLLRGENILETFAKPRRSLHSGISVKPRVQRSAGLQWHLPTGVPGFHETRRILDRSFDRSPAPKRSLSSALSSRVPDACRLLIVRLPRSGDVDITLLAGRFIAGRSQVNYEISDDRFILARFTRSNGELASADRNFCYSSVTGLGELFRPLHMWWV